MAEDLVEKNIALLRESNTSSLAAHNPAKSSIVLIGKILSQLGNFIKFEVIDSQKKVLEQYAIKYYFKTVKIKVKSDYTAYFNKLVKISCDVSVFRYQDTDTHKWRQEKILTITSIEDAKN